MRKARKNRIDISNNLPHGAVKEIADKLKCSKAYVSLVLSGYRKDHKGVIKEAELLAAINIWKERFCKFKSEL